MSASFCCLDTGGTNANKLYMIPYSLKAHFLAGNTD